MNDVGQRARQAAAGLARADTATKNAALISMADEIAAGREAIQTATVNAADHVEMSDVIGTVEPGKFADIVASDRNPLDDITTLPGGSAAHMSRTTEPLDRPADARVVSTAVSAARSRARHRSSQALDERVTAGRDACANHTASTAT